MTCLTTAGLVVIRNRKLLLAFSKNKKAWYLPGGKTDHGESTDLALIREIKEELNINIHSHQIRYYMHISAPAFGEDNLIMEQDCYLHELRQEPEPASEIEALAYFSTAEYAREPKQVPGVNMLMQQLLKDNQID